MGPALQRYIYARCDDAERRMRHGRIARALEKDGEALTAARHYRLSNQPVQAAELLLNALKQATAEVRVDNLLLEIQALSKAKVPTDLRYRLTTWAADLYRTGGDHERAIAACRTALQQSNGRVQQGQIYRRLAKLYEQRNQSHALTYYRQALDRLDPEDTEIAELLKDRGWLHLLRRDWAAAEQDLTAALARRSPDDVQLEADIYDALSSLARRQRDFAWATEHARTALSLRESHGDRLGVAKSLGNLGLIYNDQGDYAHAIAAFEEAAATYDRLGNRELSLTARLNVGLAQHLGGSLDSAISTYQRCLAEGQELGNQLAVVMTHSNLAEAFAQQGTAAAARRHWLDGFALSKHHGLDDETEYYVELSVRFEALAELPKRVQHVVADDPPAPALNHNPLPSTNSAARLSTPAGLDPAEKAAWKVAQDAGSVTAKDVMEAAQVSKPTATRKLAGLVERSLLRKEGQGRGTRYVPVAVLDAPSSLLAQRLATERTFLAQTHGVTALAVASPEPDLPTSVRLIARFEPLPDLHAFFALEKELAILCATPLRLLPESAIAPGTGSEQLQWLWAEESSSNN
jgi:tetratricopeptide (TPR) repeat protein